MKNTLITIFIFCVSLSSCKTVVSTLMGANSQKEFNTKLDYQAYVLKKYGIKSNDLYYPSKESSFHLYTKVNEHKVATFYGIFIDSNNRFTFSTFLNENKGCYGRVLKEISTDSPTFERDNLFEKVEVLNILSNNRFFPNNNKKTIVFVFSTQLGNIHKNDFKRLQSEYSDTTKYDFAFITLDDVTSFK